MNPKKIDMPIFHFLANFSLRGDYREVRDLIED